MSLQFSVTASALATAAAGAARRAPARPTHPILACVQVLGAGEQLVVSAYDNEVAVRHEVPADVDHPGQAVVSARLLAELLKTLGGARVQVEGRVQERDLVLQIGRSQVSLPLMPAKDYPALPSAPQPIGEVDGAGFAAMLKRVMVAVDRSGKGLPAMAGVFLNLTGDAVEMIATDRYQAAIGRVPFTAAPEHAGTAQAVVEAGAMAEVAEMFALPAQVAVGVSRHLVGFGAGGRALSSTTIIAEPLHVNVPQMFPAESAHPVVVSVAALKQQVQAAALLNTDDKRPAVLTFADATITVEARGHEASRGTGTAAVDCEYDGPDLTIGFQPRRLIDALSSIKTDTVLCHLTSPEKPMMVTSADQDAVAYRHLVMPVSPRHF